MADERCTVELGTADTPSVLRVHIERTIKDNAVRIRVESYLATTGVLMGRTQPPGWFVWMDARHTRFAARCADPPSADAPDDGAQPWNFFVFAEVNSRSKKLKAFGISPLLEREADLIAKRRAAP